MEFDSRRNRKNIDANSNGSKSRNQMELSASKKNQILSREVLMEGVCKEAFIILKTGGKELNSYDIINLCTDELGLLDTGKRVRKIVLTVNTIDGSTIEENAELMERIRDLYIEYENKIMARKWGMQWEG